MKKIVSLAVLAALSTPAFADAGDWYFGGRAELSFMNWENEYSLDGGRLGSDAYSFQAIFGGAAFVGHEIDANWRAEVEAGVIGQFEDADQGFEFKMTVPYMLANGYYDFENGWYVGAGLGFALPKTELNNAHFVSGDATERAFSVMGAMMFGWTHELDESLTLDLRYRLSMFSGTDHVRTFDDGAYTAMHDLSNAELSNEIGLIFDNSISIALRYNF